MMKQLMGWIIGMVFVLLQAHAAPGPLYTATFNPTNVIITPTANHFYPNMGIQIKTPGYTLSGCTLNSNGFCIFPASKTAPATVGIAGPSGPIQGVICLNGKSPYSCQQFNGMI